jgi:hypothetical protein
VVDFVLGIAERTIVVVIVIVAESNGEENGRGD